MENLLLMADQLLLGLMMYEKVLDCLTSLDIDISSQMRASEKAVIADNDILLARITTTTAVREMYDMFRLQKWEEIQSLSSRLEETAASIGYTSFQSIITDVRHAQEAPEQSNSVTDYWLAKESQFFRRD